MDFVCVEIPFGFFLRFVIPFVKLSNMHEVERFTVSHMLYIVYDNWNSLYVVRRVILAELVCAPQVVRVAMCSLRSAHITHQFEIE